MNIDGWESMRIIEKKIMKSMVKMLNDIPRCHNTAKYHILPCIVVVLYAFH